MTTTEFVARLQNARRNADGWSARCPAHDDSNPSLSVREGQDGRVLLHCHAGCTPAQIIAAMGVNMSDLFPSRTPNNTTGRMVRTYDYRDAGGAVAYQVCRFEPKSFRQR